MIDWERIQYAVQISGSGIAFILNYTLIKLIINHSPKDIGAYKYLMLFIAIFEMFYALFDVIVQPIFYSFGGTFMLIVDTRNSKVIKSFWEILAVVYCGFFGSTMAILSLHYAYRYWVVSGQKDKLKWFQGRKILIWSIIPFTCGLIWSTVGYFLCYPRKSTNDYLRDSVQEKLGLKIEDIVYFAPYFYEKNENGKDVIYWPSFFGISLDSMIIDISLVAVGYFGIKCWNKMHLIFSSSSTHHQHLQSQLFNALVAQTLIPVFLMHIPVLTMFMLSFFELNVGALSGVVSMTIALFPALDPLPTILIVCHYRNAVRNYFTSKYRRFWKSKFGRYLISKKKKSVHPCISTVGVL